MSSQASTLSRFSRETAYLVGDFAALSVPAAFGYIDNIYGRVGQTFRLRGHIEIQNAIDSRSETDDWSDILNHELDILDRPKTLEAVMSLIIKCAIFWLKVDKPSRARERKNANFFAFWVAPKVGPKFQWRDTCVRKPQNDLTGGLINLSVN